MDIQYKLQTLLNKLQFENSLERDGPILLSELLRHLLSIISPQLKAIQFLDRESVLQLLQNHPLLQLRINWQNIRLGQSLEILKLIEEVHSLVVIPSDRQVSKVLNHDKVSSRDQFTELINKAKSLSQQLQVLNGNIYKQVQELEQLQHEINDELRMDAAQYIKELNKFKVEAAQDLKQIQIENKETKHVINQLDEEIRVERQALDGLQTELRQLQMTPNAFQHRTEETTRRTRKLKADYSETHILIDQTRHLGEHETMSHLFGSWQRAKS